MNVFSAPRGGLTGAALKGIAMAAMVLDHVGAALIEPDFLVPAEAPPTFWLAADTLLRGVGRVSFPLFCFLLAEGFAHTRSAARYLARLALFALVSEVPYDLAFSSGADASAQNVFFTLAAGMMTLMALKRFSGRALPMALSLAAGCALAQALRADYGAAGVVLIAALWLLREKRAAMLTAMAAIALWISRALFGAGALAALPAAMYGGARGTQRFKHAFYLFYPAHLLALWALRRALFGG